MTVTNYQGEARVYLEKLIEACGARFTRNMTTSNSHLIAARYDPLKPLLTKVKLATSANTPTIGVSML
jgi:hypothetical protein